MILIGMMLSGVLIGWLLYMALSKAENKFLLKNKLDKNKTKLWEYIAGYIYILLCGIPILGFLLILIGVFTIYLLTTSDDNETIRDYRKDYIKRVKENK